MIVRAGGGNLSELRFGAVQNAAIDVSGGPTGGGPGGAMFGGNTGLYRLFGSAMGTEISWLSAFET